MDKEDLRWMELCRQMAHEQDPKKLNELIAELGLLLEQREQRLKAKKPLDETSD
jgi:hypothetical protein